MPSSMWTDPILSPFLWPLMDISKLSSFLSSLSDEKVMAQLRQIHQYEVDRINILALSGIKIDPSTASSAVPKVVEAYRQTP